MKVNYKKIIKISILLVVILLVFLFLFKNISFEKVNENQNLNTNEISQNEIEPAEELDSNDENLSEIQLFFKDKTSNILTPEIRKIPAKELIDDPYTYVLEELLKGPNDENLVQTIPENTKLNGVNFEKGIVTIDLSKDFLNFNGTDAIDAIKQTLNQFNEINEIKFLIDGKTNSKIG